MHNTPFLQLVAQDIRAHYTIDQLKDLVIVMPNRRARLFLNNYLHEAYATDFWSPDYVTPSELFAQAKTDWQIADPIVLIAHLYTIYKKVYEEKHEGKTAEELNDFYFFGETLLNDFNDTDKYLANATLLFKNLDEAADLNDDFSHLSDEQRDTIKRFLVAPRIGNSEQESLTERFLSVWNLLLDIYTQFRDLLKSKNIAYEGMLYREVIEDFGRYEQFFEGKQFVFIGFNVLTKCEEELFTKLKAQAKYYWDYDKYFFENNNEAGLFLKQNLEKFPNALNNLNNDIINDENNRKEIIIIKAPNEIAQTCYIEAWLEKINKQETDNVENANADNQTTATNVDSAIVLCNEQLIHRCIHAIPPQYDDVNITMGFPVNQTSIANFVALLIDFQQRAYVGKDDDERIHFSLLQSVLSHPYATIIFEHANLLNKHIVDNHWFHLYTHRSYTLNEKNDTTIEITPKDNPLFGHKNQTAKELVEYLYTIVNKIGIYLIKSEKSLSMTLELEATLRIFQTLTQLNDLLARSEGEQHDELATIVQINNTTIASLLKRMVGALSVPFHGEPAKGLQLMGTMETRNMDFDNVLVLSTNECMFPRGSHSSTSFIPNSFRKFYGMSHTDHIDSLYAYHFYHILHRAKNITFIYSTGKDGGSKGEESRFLLQLKHEYPFKEQIKYATLSSEAQNTNLQPKAVERTEEINRRIDEIAGKFVSPSSLNTYVDCPLKYYMQCVLKLKEQDELSEDIDNALIGTLFHRAMEAIYRKIGNINFDVEVNEIAITEATIKQIKDNDTAINEAINEAYRIEYFKSNNYNDINEDDYTGAHLIYREMIRDYVKRQLELDSTLAPFTIVGLEKKVEYDFKLDNGKTIKLGGFIDRLDKLNDGTLRIIDYKTSKKAKNSTKDIDILFNKGTDRPHHLLQVLIYTLIIYKQSQGKSVIPALVYVTQLKNNEINDISCYFGGNKKNNITEVVFKNNEPLVREFEEKLKELLTEIFCNNAPFNIIEGNHPCQYCPFNLFCNK